MEDTNHYFGCKVKGLQEHMAKYLHTPHGSKLYFESFLMVQIVQVSKINDDGTCHHSKAFSWNFRHDRSNTHPLCSHDPGMKFAHFPPSLD
jgi:hypothetical protein